MFSVPAAFAAKCGLNFNDALFVFSVDTFPYSYTQGNTGRQNEFSWITDIGDWSVGVDELNGSYTIDDLDITVLDYNGGVTAALAGVQLETQRCTLRMGFAGMALADYAVLFTGLVSDISRTSNNTYTFTCQDFNRLAQHLIYTEGDNITVTTTTTTLSGNVYTATAVAVTTNRATGVQTSVTTTSQTLNGVVGTVITTDSAAISSNNTRTLIGHPLDLLLDIMLNQVGFAAADVNVAQVQQFRDSVFAGVEVQFLLDSAVDAKDFIESQILKPLAGYTYPDNLGRICVGFLQPNPAALAAQLDINADNIQAIPTLTPQTLINVVTMRFDKDDSGEANSSTGYLSESNTLYLPGIANLEDLTGQLALEQAHNASAVQGQTVIESDGMRSGFQGYLLSKMVSASIFAKYGSRNPSMEAKLLWTPAYSLQIGDFVTVTHPLITDRRQGTLGLSGARYQVIKRAYNFGNTMTVTLTINDASGIRTYAAHKIAPNGKPAYGGASQADHDAYIFISNAQGAQTGGAQAATLG